MKSVRKRVRPGTASAYDDPSMVNANFPSQPILNAPGETIRGGLPVNENRPQIHGDASDDVPKVVLEARGQPRLLRSRLVFRSRQLKRERDVRPRKQTFGRSHSDELREPLVARQEADLPWQTLTNRE